MSIDQDQKIRRQLNGPGKSASRIQRAQKTNREDSVKRSGIFCEPYPKSAKNESIGFGSSLTLLLKVFKRVTTTVATSRRATATLIVFDTFILLLVLVPVVASIANQSQPTDHWTRIERESLVGIMKRNCSRN
jgi:hypothetical protein